VPLRYVIFDCDGVLVDSEPIANRVLAEALTRIGLPMTEADSTAAFMGRSWASNLEEIEARLGRKAPPDLRARYLDDMHAAFERELQPVPGIAAALDRIGLPWCVASSSDPEQIRFVLEHTGLLERFTQPASPAGTGTQPASPAGTGTQPASPAGTGTGRLFSTTEVEHGKPAPDLFLHAATRMGWEPAHCAVVEDSPAGVQAGLAAGMTVLGYAGRTDPALLAGAHVFTRMDELPELLQPPE
jgi:beta-phosphoglucomutase-like phosphatase (HAD superfamily)